MLKNVVNVDLQRHRRGGDKPVESAQQEQAQLCSGGDGASSNATQGVHHA